MRVRPGGGSPRSPLPPGEVVALMDDKGVRRRLCVGRGGEDGLTTNFLSKGDSAILALRLPCILA